MYATQQDIIDTYGQNALLIAADHSGTGVVDAAAVAKALADVSALMDTYIGAKYELPLPTVPAVLTQQCVDIALYRLSPTGAVTDDIRTRHEDAMTWLRQLSRGEVSLGIDPAPPSSGGGVFASGNPRRFTRQSLRGS